jgi:hypothetical protein
VCVGDMRRGLTTRLSYAAGLEQLKSHSLNTSFRLACLRGPSDWVDCNCMLAEDDAPPQRAVDQSQCRSLEDELEDLPLSQKTEPVAEPVAKPVSKRLPLSLFSKAPEPAAETDSGIAVSRKRTREATFDKPPISAKSELAHAAVHGNFPEAIVTQYLCKFRSQRRSWVFLFVVDSLAFAPHLSC